MSAEFEDYGIAVNSLWPLTIISTAAVDNLMGETGMNQGRKPEIMADAAYAILTTTDRKITGQALIDEVILREHGITDFDQYAYKPGEELMPDFYIDN
jgi:citronellol/citronellal dehydrogenase